MQLNSEERAAFYRRTVVSVVTFVCILSVGANIFLMVTRPAGPPLGAALPTPFEESLLLVPQAFGTVQRGFARKPLATSVNGQALAPAASYILPAAEFQSLVASLPLYRDQGVPLDEPAVEKVFEDLGVSMEWKDLQLLPTTQRWRSSDKSMEIALDIEKRALTVSRLGTFSADPDGRAEDDVTVAIAKEFADSLGIAVSPYGSPAIVERTADGGSTRTYVVWPMVFGGLPLLDSNAAPVPAVQVQVGRLSRKALSMTVTLLSSEHIALSAYPRASREMLERALLQGGMLPVASGLPGSPQDVVYSEIRKVYILLPGEKGFPTYIVPALQGLWTQGTAYGSTFVPGLDPSQFLWDPIPPAPTSEASQ